MTCAGLTKDQTQQERIALALEVQARMAAADVSSIDRMEITNLLAQIKVIRECEHRNHKGGAK